MFQNKSVSTHQFAMVPQPDVPRSSFIREFTHKSTFSAGVLIPIYVDEVLPGDTFNLRMTAFCRMATPLYPTMDNIHLDTFFFYIPNRLIWQNWRKFMGEQANPTDSISYVVPTIDSPTGGYATGSLGDYFGLPTAGQVGAGNTITSCSFWHRAYNLTWNEWFRDENLQDSVVVDVDDGPDDTADYGLLRRGKRHDYFTSSLPWPQKGDTAVSLPLGTSAPVKGIGVPSVGSTTSASVTVKERGDDSKVYGHAYGTSATQIWLQAAGADGQPWPYADLSTATAATINQLRQSFQIQALLEKDARSGTRYTEIIRSHFGVASPDARLQRPEYLGGGTTRVNVSAIAQTSGTAITGSDTPLGQLGGLATALVNSNGFSQSFVEHGVVLGLAAIRADLTYQQGMRRMFSRSTRYDFYFPAFANLGEQTVLSKEIFATGDAADENVWGYQERWAEYRFLPSLITGHFKSTGTTPLDAWHAAQEFSTRPTLSDTFMQDTPPIERIIAIGATIDSQQFLFDSVFSVNSARPLPMYSTPGSLMRM